MMELVNKLSETANVSRLNAVDAAYAGNPYAGSNFKASWQGYNNDGQAIVKYQNQVYTAKSIASAAAKSNQTVILRVAKNYRSVNY